MSQTKRERFGDAIAKARMRATQSMTYLKKSRARLMEKARIWLICFASAMVLLCAVLFGVLRIVHPVQTQNPHGVSQLAQNALAQAAEIVNGGSEMTFELQPASGLDMSPRKGCKTWLKDVKSKSCAVDAHGKTIPGRKVVHGSLILCGQQCSSFIYDGVSGGGKVKP